MKNRISAMLLAVFAGLLPFAAGADNSTSIPGYVIHHNAFTTDALTPDVARRLNLQRSTNRGMLNVSIIKVIPGTIGKSVSGEVTATATNLTGQLRTIPMREVKDGDAVYYLGDFRVTDGETLNFEISVKPSGEEEMYSAKLSQQFYTD
jgi:hypothetical protein